MFSSSLSPTTSKHAKATFTDAAKKGHAAKPPASSPSPPPLPKPSIEDLVFSKVDFAADPTLFEDLDSVLTPNKSINSKIFIGGPHPHPNVLEVDFKLVLDMLTGIGLKLDCIKGYSALFFQKKHCFYITHDIETLKKIVSVKFLRLEDKVFPLSLASLDYIQLNVSGLAPNSIQHTEAFTHRIFSRLGDLMDTKVESHSGIASTRATLVF